ncbi:IS982 family transposase [Tenacibaculum sp. M341]|uniref:IS982 family transposase n=1 Tax=Tenacibaculum sp. M341 TaxID=2530339 RepID=UPI001053B066|nr:IS982 family transposase [Tenacibaculum sp. M341]TCI83767.1 IS982 family transposase [Tenacibaculum sp. M341]
MHNFQANYDKIYLVLKDIFPEQLLTYQRRKPKLSDLSLISINLTAEYMSIDSESDLFRKLPCSLFNSIERSVYNRRKRKLFSHIEAIRNKLSDTFNDFENTFIIDSMPLEVCKISRSKRSKICKEHSYSYPNKGYCASQGSKYYGYKLHAVCSIEGIFKSIDISPASVHDINYLKDIQTQLKDCTLIGDRGYLSTEYQLNLFETSKIKLNVPMRNNQHNYKEQPYIYRKSRKRIETLFSQLCDQFMIRRNYAKSFEGFKTRILSKITALTLIQYINKFIFNRNINNIKINIT